MADNQKQSNNNQSKKTKQEREEAAAKKREAEARKEKEMEAVKAAEKRASDLRTLVSDAIAKKGSTKTEGKATYGAAAVDTQNKSDLAAAKKELATYDALCKKFDKSVLDYKEWAKQKVIYSDNMQSIRDNLRSCNDGYTMSTIMDMLNPLQQGITFQALAQIWLQSKIIERVDPDFSMNESRLAERLRRDILDKKNSSSVAKRLLKGFDDKLLGISTGNLGKEITRNFENATLDDMVMTPRQIAAIKLNFAEQCYVDMRKVSTIGEIENIKTRYNTAVDHLASIAKNSGFDMSVVATEERYLVGLKMKDDQSYGDIFFETCDLRTYPAHVEGEPWVGDFETYDGKVFTTGHGQTGAFTPRMPYVVLDAEQGTHHSQAELEHIYKKRAEYFAMAMCYLEDSGEEKVCEFDPKIRKAATQQLTREMEKFVEQSKRCLADDGLSIDWEKNFDNVYMATRSNIQSGHGSENINEYKRFVSELKSGANKEIISNVLNENIPSFRTSDYRDYEPSKRQEYRLQWYGQVAGQINRVADKLHKTDEGHNYYKKKDSENDTRLDKRTGEQIINDARRDQLYNCSAEDAVSILMKTAVNMYQGHIIRGTSGRVDTLCFESDEYKSGMSQLKGANSDIGETLRGFEFDNIKEVPIDVGLNCP